MSTPSGPIPALLPPGKTNAFEPRMDAVPGLGQHTDAVLDELGWGKNAVAGMRKAGVI